MATKTLTQNEALTYSSSGDARLDFLFHVIEGSSPKRTSNLLAASWAHSPLDTLKLVFNARDIRGGKGIRAQWLICAHWLYLHHFESLLANLELLTEPFGCWKDLPNLLLVALFNDKADEEQDGTEKKKQLLLPYDAFSDSTRKEPVISHFDRHILCTVASKEERQALAQTKTTIRQIRRRLIVVKSEEEKEEEEKATTAEAKSEAGDQAVGDNGEPKRSRISRQIDTVTSDASETPLEYRKRASYFPEKEQATFKAVYRVKTDRGKLKTLSRHRYHYFNKIYKDSSSNFARLYDRVVQLFARQLLTDLENQQAGKPFSLAAKWLPSPGRLFDKYLFIHVAIGRRLLELQKNPTGVSLASHRQVERHFRKAVYGPLRAAIQLPEAAMSARAWSAVNYYRVPSQAMMRYKAVYSRADFGRFAEFVADKPVKGGALTPGEIVAETVKLAFQGGTLYGELLTEMEPETRLQLEVLDAQWKSLVEDVKSKGTLLIKDALAICDVSGSMLDSSQKVLPMYGAIGLTLLLLQLGSQGAWRQKVIAFSESPSLGEIDTESEGLRLQIKRLTALPIGYTTNLNKAFALLIEEARKLGAKRTEMPKVLFIFTDMEFNEALPEKTNFEAAQIQFAQAGYSMPLVVFWNLKGDKASRSTPVQCHQEGVFLLSGYSAQTINFFFTASDVKEMTPLTMLERILNDARYAPVRLASEDVLEDTESSSSSAQAREQPMAVDDEQVEISAAESPMRE